MKKFLSILLLCISITAVITSAALPALASGVAPAALSDISDDEAAVDNTTGSKAIASGIAIGLAAAGGALGMGIAISKSAEGIARQPEAESKIRTTMMLGLVFIETAIIYALIITILIIFVL